MSDAPPAPADPTEDYLAVVEQRLTEHGFRWLDEVELETCTVRAAASHKRFAPSRVGMAERHFVFADATSVDRDMVVTLGEAAFEFAQRNALTWLPRGFGRAVECFAVAVGRIVVPELAAEVRGTELVPKHWAAIVFPVLVDLSVAELHYRQTTPVWGAAYARSLRETADSFLAPPAPA